MDAFSKINLILEVVGKRQDGYHELKSIMQSLALHDTLTIETAVSNGASHAPRATQGNFQLICSDPNLPTDDRNLVTRAAKYMMQEYNITTPVSIKLEKRIPVAAGLAGGSSDCAAALLGLNNLFNLNIPLHSTSQTSLMEIGKRFGADVPFCLMANASPKSVTALAEGIGEKLTQLAPHPFMWVVLACPDIPVSTPGIFGRLGATALTQARINSHESACPVMIQALEKSDNHAIFANLKNDLARVTIELYPEIQDIIDEMKNHDAQCAAMSGSGPSVYGYFTQKEQAEKAYKNFQNITGRIFLTKINT